MYSKKMLLALISLCGSQVMADTLPDICNTTINYTAQTLNLGFMEKQYDPKSIVLRKDLNKFPISNVAMIDDCQNIPVNPKWCEVAGGVPVVFQADVAKVGTGGSYPLATVVVTYNRGGCWVDQVTRK